MNIVATEFANIPGMTTPLPGSTALGFLVKEHSMHWFKSAWLIAPAALVAISTTAAQSTAAPGMDEAQIRAIVKSIYATYNQPGGDGSKTLVLKYSPSTAALYKQYEPLLADAVDGATPLGNYDNYCQCYEYDEKEARLQAVNIVRIGPDLMDATAQYVLFRGEKLRTTRIRFERSRSWKIHDVFWPDGTTLRGTLIDEIASHSPSTKRRRQ